MQKMKSLFEMGGMEMNIGSGREFQASMSAIAQNRPRLQTAISHICAKPMRLAEYYCTGTELDSRHYALNEEHYTHMTSPIRRYADIVVHRLLLAKMGLADTSLTTEQVQKIAEVCNNRKYAAQRCQEASNKMYMQLYIQRNVAPLEDAVVVGVYRKDRSLDILVPRLGIQERVFLCLQDGKIVYKYRYITFFYTAGCERN